MKRANSIKKRGPKPQHNPTYVLLRGMLRQWREERNFTQAEVARRMKRPQSFVAKVEHGTRRIDPIEWLAFLDALGVDPIEAIKRIRVR